MIMMSRTRSFDVAPRGGRIRMTHPHQTLFQLWGPERGNMTLLIPLALSYGLRRSSKCRQTRFSGCYNSKVFHAWSVWQVERGVLLGINCNYILYQQKKLGDVRGKPLLLSEAFVAPIMNSQETFPSSAYKSWESRRTKMNFCVWIFLLSTKNIK